MVFFLIVAFILGLIELLFGYLPHSNLQKPIALILSLLLVCASAGVLASDFAIWSILFCLFSIFRMINLFRLVEGHKQADYLRTMYFRAGIGLMIYQLIAVGVGQLFRKLAVSYNTKVDILLALQLMVAVIIALSLRRSLNKTKPNLSARYINDKDLPDVTVAIPARNETDDLKQCLESLVASDYPKLEIIVLDDCSQNKHTPEIIKQFAHDGVRFLAGDLTPDFWLAKNYGYEQLTEAANGQYLLFCGVDLRFSTDSIGQMVEVMLARRKKMMSFIPINSSNDLGGLKKLAIQPWRYFWELGLPRRFLNRPPVLSSCWLIDKTSLIDLGGFKAVGRDVVPERYFARETARKSDGYSFIRSSSVLGLASFKDFSEQRATAIRTRYPLLKQRLDLTSLISLAELIVFVLPVVVTLVELVYANWWQAVISGLDYLIVGYCFSRVVKLTYNQRSFFSLIATPLLALYDVYLLLSSMRQYEFGEVIWKGRNVCIPVMRTIQKSTSDYQMEGTIQGPV